MERHDTFTRWQRGFRWSLGLDVFSNFHSKKKRKNKTTHQSLMVPSFTSSFCWEERGLRCAVVCGSTHLRSVVHGRCCERSQGQHLPHRVVVGQQWSGECRRHRTCKRAAGNCFDV